MCLYLKKKQVEETRNQYIPKKDNRPHQQKQYSIFYNKLCGHFIQSLNLKLDIHGMKNHGKIQDKYLIPLNVKPHFLYLKFIIFL